MLKFGPRRRCKFPFLISFSPNVSPFSQIYSRECFPHKRREPCYKRRLLIEQRRGRIVVVKIEQMLRHNKNLVRSGILDLLARRVASHIDHRAV